MENTPFDFEHLNLVPQKCIVSSRSECDTSLKLKEDYFKLPVIPANMECIIDERVAKKLAKEGYLYSMHRFGDILSFTESMKNENLFLSISIGVNEDSMELCKKLVEKDIEPSLTTIDIAHGHAIKMERMIPFVRNLFPNTIIMAGNVSTAEGVRDLESWGADIIKVGIGPGYACTTYTATGFGSRGCQASIIYECSKARQKPETKICADGGIREPGDIVKSLALGADLVMVGGMFSGFLDSPGTIVEIGGKQYKEFWGSASHFQSNKSSRIEGTKKLIELKPHGILEEMNHIQECLQSAISYAGGKNLEALKNVKHILKK